MSSLNGRKMFGNVVHCMPMVDDLLMGLHGEYHFFINYMAGVDEIPACFGIANGLESPCHLWIEE